jgi:hypothetical protein
MDAGEKDDGAGLGLGRTAGTRASDSELTANLAQAPPPFLEGALSNPDLQPSHVVLLLRNRSVPASLLTRLAKQHRWTRLYEVKRGLVLHPNTPPTIARTFLHHMYWRDLSEAADDLRLHPSVRRQAEETVKVRLAEMAVGERIALARRATRGVIAALAEEADRMVLAALLENRRLVERDVVTLAGGENVPGEVLDAVSRNPAWGIRPAVRTALLRNPRTPVHAAMRLVKDLPERELRRIQADRTIPKIVRVGAERALEATRGPDPPSVGADS